MIERREIRPLQAEEIARAFRDEGVDYLFIGKSGAILLGYRRLPAGATHPKSAARVRLRV